MDRHHWIAACVALASLAEAPALASQASLVRVRSAGARYAHALTPSSSSRSATRAVTGVVCDEDALALDTQLLPGGGRLDLDPVTFSSVNLGTTGRIAFYSRVTSSQNRHGIFVADSNGVQWRVRGSGAGFGTGSPGAAVGDPTPIGGLFTGLYPSAPAFNAAGDLLFVADVNGGTASRGLFLYRASSQAIEKVAAVGDPAPGGGTLGTIGRGTMNASSVVVFVATGATTSDQQILRWENGALTRIARVGDPAPSFGNYQGFGVFDQTQPDGTTFPDGNLPHVNAAGSISFVAFTTGLGMHGVVGVDALGNEQWLGLTGDPTPNGGTFFQYWEPILNDAGELAVLCSYTPSSGGLSAGWFVGTRSNWRKAIVAGDSVAGGQVTGFNFYTGSPVSPASNEGDLVVWADVATATGSKQSIVLCRASGAVEEIRGTGDPTSLGGTISNVDAWPAINSAGQVTLYCRTPGATGGVQAACFLLALCPVVESYCTAGTTSGGCAPHVAGTGVPSASAANGFAIDVAGAPAQTSGILFYGLSGRAVVPWAAGSSSWLCVRSPLNRAMTAATGGSSGACDGALSLDFNAVVTASAGLPGPSLAAGTRIDAQAWFYDAGAPKGSNLSDALEFWLAP